MVKIYKFVKWKNVKLHILKLFLAVYLINSYIQYRKHDDHVSVTVYFVSENLPRLR